MIFVTVGTDTHQFNRLLREIDVLIEKKIIKERVIAQIGNSEYRPKNYDYFRFADYKKYIGLIKKARLVVSHGGAGTIITVLSYKKPLIVVPRLKKFGEHTDDHQKELVTQLDKDKRAIAVLNIKKLGEFIKKVKACELNVKEQKTVKIISILSKKIEIWSKERC